MTKFNKVQDSGKRQQFNTGSQRDTDEGKGKPHLIAGEPFIKLNEYKKNRAPLDNEQHSDTESLTGEIENCLLRYTEIVENREQNLNYILQAMDLTCILISWDEGGGYHSAFKRLAIHYENGAKKYDANNWRKGQPVSRYYDSAKRHLDKLIDGSDDEDHYSALLWNLVGIVQTKIDVEKGILPVELDNYPFTLKEVFGGKND